MILILITAISLNTNIQKLSAAEKIMSSQIKYEDSIISEIFILTDSATLHTSYSVQIEYQIV